MSRQKFFTFKKVGSAAVTLCVAGLIFYFSSQPGTISREVSAVVATEMQSTSVGRFFSPAWFTSLDANANIRHLAHIYIYCALGFWSALTAHFWREQISLNPIRTAACAGAFCLLYACSDELHQWFVPGRSALLFDIFLDGSGAFSGIMIALILLWMISHFRIRHISQDSA